MKFSLTAEGTFGLLYLIQLAAQVLAGTKFASHVSVSTPARSFTHGVGDPLPLYGRKTYRSPQKPFTSFRRPLVSSQPSSSQGYPRVKPAIPFNNEELPRGIAPAASPWQHNRNNDDTIPVLPPSPYKVDSSDPESLWPEGLFLPPITPPRFGMFNRRINTELDLYDPYLLEGSEAIAAVAKADDHGQLFFHDIPHIESLLENQELRVKNNLKPHRLGSIRHTWPFNRP